MSIRCWPSGKSCYSPGRTERREDSIGGAGRRQSALAGTCDQAALKAPRHPPTRGLPFGAAMAATVSFRKPALGFVASIGALTRPDVIARIDRLLGRFRQRRLGRKMAPPRACFSSQSTRPRPAPRLPLASPSPKAANKRAVLALIGRGDATSDSFHRQYVVFNQARILREWKSPHSLPRLNLWNKPADLWDSRPTCRSSWSSRAGCIAR